MAEEVAASASLGDTIQDVTRRLRELHSRCPTLAEMTGEEVGMMSELDDAIDALRGVAKVSDKEQGEKWTMLVQRVSSALRQDASKIHLLADGEIDFTKHDIILRLHKKFRIFCVCETRDVELSPERSKTPMKDSAAKPATVTPQKPIPAPEVKRTISPLRTGGIIRIVPRPISAGPSAKTVSPGPTIRRSGTPIAAAARNLAAPAIGSTAPRAASSAVTRTTTAASRTTSSTVTRNVAPASAKRPATSGVTRPAAKTTTSTVPSHRVPAKPPVLAPATAAENGSAKAAPAARKTPPIPALGFKRVAAVPSSKVR